jgi:hypothetical protein
MSERARHIAWSDDSDEGGGASLSEDRSFMMQAPQALPKARAGRSWGWRLLGVFSVCTFCVLGVVDTPRVNAMRDELGSLIISAREASYHLWFDKEVEISGISADYEEIIRQALPLERSSVWWIVNRSSIAARLAMLPRVQSASLTSCAGSWGFRCFQLDIQERYPYAVALLADHAWIVGRDGGFIQPLQNVRSSDDVQTFIEGSSAALVALDGVQGKEGTLDLVRGRLQYTADIIRTIESEVPLRVTRVSLEQNGEARVSFKGRSYVAIFGFMGSDLSTVGQEARRLNHLLPRIDQRGGIVKEIDLAFQKVAVVRFE